MNSEKDGDTHPSCDLSKFKREGHLANEKTLPPLGLPVERKKSFLLELKSFCLNSETERYQRRP
jgi:hypothetical protein